MSWLLAAVLVTATLYGLLADRAYRLDRKHELESIAQDVLTLAIVPLEGRGIELPRLAAQLGASP